MKSHRLAWPADVELAGADVLIGGYSVADLARAAGTPCLRIVPRERGVAHPAFQTVLVTTVVDRGTSTVRGIRELWLDADLGRCSPFLDAARLVGRVGSRRRVRTLLRPSASWVGSGEAHLPDDVRVGDLIAIPCLGASCLSDVRRSQRTVG